MYICVSEVVVFHRKPVDSIIRSATVTEHGPLRATVEVCEWVPSYELSSSIHFATTSWCLDH